MESVMLVLSYLFMSLLFALFPASAVGIWVYRGKAFSNLTKEDRMSLLIVTWLLCAMGAYQYIYHNLDTFTPIALWY